MFEQLKSTNKTGFRCQINDTCHLENEMGFWCFVKVYVLRLARDMRSGASTLEGDDSAGKRVRVANAGNEE